MILHPRAVADLDVLPDAAAGAHRHVGTEANALPQMGMVAEEGVRPHSSTRRHLGIETDDRPRLDDRRAPNWGRRARAATPARQTSQHRTVLELHALPDGDVVMQHDVGADFDAIGDLHPDTDQQIRSELGRAKRGQGLRVSQRMAQSGELGVDSICCLLHNMVPGGSGRQWVHLLGRHVVSGGKATIVAPTGALIDLALASGVEVIPFSWDDGRPADLDRLLSSISRHDVAVVHWDHEVMDAFGPALSACGRAALALHQAPRALARWFGPEILRRARIPLDRALAEEHAVALVRGESHRNRVATAFDIQADGLRILPASIPLTPVPFRPQLGEPREILALMRLSPDKAAIAQLAVELTRARLATKRPCHLTIAGDGPWRDEATALCEQRLPPGSWRMERAPADPVARLAASDLIVAQGLTTLEAAAIGRRVIVARAIDEDRPAGTVLIPGRYDVAARDPFGEPPVTAEVQQLWEEILGVGDEELGELRRLVERHNSLGVASRALGEAIAATAS